MIVKEWKIIEKASNYEISNYGEVKNKITNQISKPTLVGGYLSIGLPINNKNVTSFIHRLVATKFLTCLDESFVVNHKDGDKINNNVENLEWVSRSENAKHAFRLDLNKGKKSTRQKASRRIVERERWRWRSCWKRQQEVLEYIVQQV